MRNIETFFSADTSLNAAKLFIDTSALKANYQKLSHLSQSALCAAVVKADAYGLGLEGVAPALIEAGCTHFFVAQPTEGETLRKLLPEARIMILNGLYDGAADFYREYGLVPVLNSVEEIKSWADAARKADAKLPALIHVDTGMNRLGLTLAQMKQVFDKGDDLSCLDLLYVISHLACADDPENDKNAEQLAAFSGLLTEHPEIKASLANSGGVINGPEYHFDLTRPGYALYGGRASTAEQAVMTPVVHLRSRILQIRELQTGESVGYGASWQATRPSVIATLPVGYADGYARLHGVENGKMSGHVAIDGVRVPIIGRISMDLMAIDLTELASLPSLRNMSVELIGSHITIDDLAESAQTIGYEVLTTLGKRYQRHYDDAI